MAVPAMAQDAKPVKPVEEKTVLPEVKSAQANFDHAAKEARTVYAKKQIVAKKSFVFSATNVFKVLMKSKRIDNAEVASKAKKAAEQEIVKLATGKAVEFPTGDKNAPTLRSALRRHDTSVASARRIYVRALTLAKKAQIKELDAALTKAAGDADFKKSKTINEVLKLAKKELANIGKQPKQNAAAMEAVSGGVVAKLEVGAVTISSLGHKWGPIRPTLKGSHYLRVDHFSRPFTLRCVNPGTLYVRTDAAGSKHGKGSSELYLKSLGFKIVEKYKSGDAEYVIMSKYVKKGEKITAGGGDRVALVVFNAVSK